MLEQETVNQHQYKEPQGDYRMYIRALLVAVVLVVVFGLLVPSIREGGQVTVDVHEERVGAPRDPFERLYLQARAVYVWDVSRGEVLHAKNAEAQLPLASLTKLMTAVTAADVVPQSATVNIGYDAIAAEGDSGLMPEEQWQFADLLDFMLLVSSNDGAYAIASVAGAFANGADDSSSNRSVFIRRMNEKARELGLAQTYFVNETGLDASKYVGGGYGSARDMALLF